MPDSDHLEPKVGKVSLPSSVVELPPSLSRARSTDGVDNTLMLVPSGATTRAWHLSAGVAAHLLLSASSAALK